MLDQLKKKKALESLRSLDNDTDEQGGPSDNDADNKRSPSSEDSEGFRKAVNEQYIRYNQEIGTSPHSSSYNGEVLGRGREDDLNQKVMMPVIEKNFKNPNDFILKSEDYLQNLSEEEKKKMREQRPEVRDPKKNALEALRNSRLS